MTEVALVLGPADTPDGSTDVQLLQPAPSGPAALSADGVEVAVARWATAWLLSHAPTTRATYAGDVRDWLTWCTDVGVDPWTARRLDVDAWVERLREVGAAPATIGKRLAAVSGLYRYAIAEDWLPRNPAEHVRRPPAGAHQVSTGLTRDELAALAAAAAADRPRSAAVVLLLGLNGLRVSEACSARAENLGTERGHTVLGITRKGGRTARVPLAPRTAAALELALDGRTHGPVLATGTGRSMDRHAVWRLLRRLARTAVPAKAGTLHPHDLRHTFVTLALDAGASLRDVQDAAGHADPRTTRLYDRARHNLDRHPTYAVSTLVAHDG